VETGGEVLRKGKTMCGCEGKKPGDTIFIPFVYDWTGLGNSSEVLVFETLVFETQVLGVIRCKGGNTTYYAHAPTPFNDDNSYTAANCCFDSFQEAWDSRNKK
jgi:hypothetical protein